MPDTVAESAFAELFINDTPLLDVRAPIEFARGAFPTATNLPLLDDAQRAAIGRRYKQAGGDAAIALGNELISGATKAARMEQWQRFLHANPHALLYCFRGGLRSETVHRWLAQEAGIELPRVQGGYKALRRFLLDTLARVAERGDFIIVAGKTGSGKTHLINQLPGAVDLEGCANHRGSAFGLRIEPQPGQIDFENALAIAFLKLPYHSTRRIFLEDESRAIGSLSLPVALYAGMRRAPVAIIEESLESRIDITLHDYIDSNYREFRTAYPNDYRARFAEFLLSALDRIRRRLGPEHHAETRILMEQALAAQRQEEALALHRQWIRKLLKDYYDPMYDYQLNKKQREIVFRGNRDELLAWAAGINSKPIAEVS